ncbi:MAG: class I SAM-dependent methyltransferase [Saprospiraceae bacterium]
MPKVYTAREMFHKYAVDYQSKYMEQSMYHQSFDLFCDSIPNENAEILEIACGPGNITQYLLKKRPDFKILGIDLAPNMIELAKINNPAAAFQLMDCRDIATLDKQYDGIMCGFCLPYLSKEESIQLIRDAALRLRSGGVLYMSTMEDDYGKSGIQTNSGGDQLYMYFHQADYLVQALEETSFNIIAIKRQKFDANTVDLLIVARKETGVLAV